MPIDIVYNARSMGALQWGGVAIGLAFMVFGLWALFAAQTAQALALAHVGLAAGLATLGGGGPYLGTWEGVASHIQFAGTVLWGLLLLRFFLVFPNPKPVAASRLAIGAMYGAWGLFVGCMVLELIAHPALYHTFGPFGSLLTALCVILALIAIFHTVLKTSGRELWESGMGLILVGLLVAAVPTLVGTAAFMLGLDLPGARFYPLMLVALPFTMALAVMKHARRA